MTPKERLDVRLGPEHRRKLEELAARRGVPISAAVRQLIHAAYEEVLRDYRRQLVIEMSQLNGEDVPDPDELSRQLAQANDPGIP